MVARARFRVFTDRKACKVMGGSNAGESAGSDLDLGGRGREQIVQKPKGGLLRRNGKQLLEQ